MSCFAPPWVFLPSIRASIHLLLTVVQYCVILRYGQCQEAVSRADQVGKRDRGYQNSPRSHPCVQKWGMSRILKKKCRSHQPKDQTRWSKVKVSRVARWEHRQEEQENKKINLKGLRHMEGSDTISLCSSILSTLASALQDFRKEIFLAQSEDTADGIQDLFAGK